MRSLLVVGLALLAPLSAAQEEPTVNESDFDTTEPPADDAYLSDSQDLQGTGAASPEEAGEEPTLAESDFDTSEPAADDAYLDDSQDLAGTGAEGADASGSGDAKKSFLPAPALALAVATVAAVAVALKRH